MIYVVKCLTHFILLVFIPPVSNDCMCCLKLFTHLDNTIVYVVTVDSEWYYVVLHTHELKATCSVMPCVLPMWCTASDLLVNDESDWLGSEESVSGEPIFKLGGGVQALLSVSLLCPWRITSCTMLLTLWILTKRQTNKKVREGGEKKSMKRRVIIIYMEPVLCCLLFILRNWWFRRSNTPRRMLYESL